MPPSSSLLGVGCCLKGSDLEGLEWFCLKGAHSGLSVGIGGVASWVFMKIGWGEQVGGSDCGRYSGRRWGHLVGVGGNRRLGTGSPHA